MSKREELQNELVALLHTGHFNAPYGIVSGKSPDNKYREVGFGRAGTLDVSVKIYGPRFILLKYNNGAHIRFESMKDTIKYIMMNWGHCFEDDVDIKEKELKENEAPF